MKPTKTIQLDLPFVIIILIVLGIIHHLNYKAYKESIKNEKPKTDTIMSIDPHPMHPGLFEMTYQSGQMRKTIIIDKEQVTTLKEQLDQML